MILVGSDGDRIVLGEEATGGGGLLVPSPGRPGNKGDKGDKGDTGPKGDTGADSTVPGPRGIQGVQGERGPKGDTGADSTVPGPKGDRGDIGPKGDKGDTGADSVVPGPKGDKGDQGERGLQGEASTVPGPKGDKGDPGGVTTVGGFDGVVTKAQLGIDQVDNTRDADKPISDATQGAFDYMSAAFGTIIGDINTDLTTKADLDNNGKVLAAQIPAEARASFRGVTYSEAGMITLGGERGDWCTRGDRGTDFRLIANPASVPTNWLEATYPASPVSSVNGRTGAVDTSSADITDATAVGRNVLKAADAAAARSAIGAGTGNGTSNLAIGTTSSTAMRGDANQFVTVLPTSGQIAGVIYHVTE